MKLGYLSLEVAKGTVKFILALSLNVNLPLAFSQISGSWKRYWIELVAGSLHILSAPGGSVIGDVMLDQVSKICKFSLVSSQMSHLIAN